MTNLHHLLDCFELLHKEVLALLFVYALFDILFYGLLQLAELQLFFQQQQRFG
jgi:hypothetical protein